MDLFHVYGTGALLMAFYMTMGIGLTRLVSKANQRSGIRLPEVLFWPVALGVFAVTGAIEHDD